MTSLIKRVDHITIRTDDVHYDQLFKLFTEQLQLPMAWPVAERYPGTDAFKSGGVAAGSINMELFRSGSLSLDNAQLYSIALEPDMDIEESIKALDQRGIRHALPLAIPQDTFGMVGSLWTLVFIDALFGAKVSELPPLQVGTPGKDILKPRFDKAFRLGLAFLCAYNKKAYDPVQMRALTERNLRDRQGGPLGFMDTREIIIGTSGVTIGQANWQRLFDPIPARGARWQLSEGPFIRLVQAAQEGIVGLVWQVKSLEKARAYLTEQQMLGEVSDQYLTIDPSKIFGLNITLAE